MAVVNDQSLQEVSSDQCGHRISHDRQNPTCCTREAVLSSSHMQNNNALQSSVVLQPSSVSDAWEKKFIRAPKSVSVVRSKGKKENFVTQKLMNNPNYMYVSVYMDDIIPSRQKTVADRQTLTRHHSDDMLNIPLTPRHLGMPTPKPPSFKEPLYSVPFESVCNATEDSVKFDSAGYAMPNIQDTAQFKVINLSLLKFSIKYYVRKYSSLLPSPLFIFQVKLG